MEIPNHDQVSEKHSHFMEMKIFKKYKSDDEEMVSIKKLLSFDRLELQNIVFMYEDKYKQTDD